MDTLIIIGILLAIAATIVLYIKVMPKKYDGKLKNKFLQFLHDFFNFKTFYIEALTKFVFVLLTCACIFVGFLLLFGKIEYYGYFGATFEQSSFRSFTCSIAEILTPEPYHRFSRSFPNLQLP